jgi:hypothetical protein
MIEVHTANMHGGLVYGKLIYRRHFMLLMIFIVPGQEKRIFFLGAKSACA